MDRRGTHLGAGLGLAVGWVPDSLGLEGPGVGIGQNAKVGGYALELMVRLRILTPYWRYSLY
jgi:hypothetical protein